MRFSCDHCGAHDAAPGTCPICHQGTLHPFAGEPMAHARPTRSHFAELLLHEPFEVAAPQGAGALRLVTALQDPTASKAAARHLGF